MNTQEIAENFGNGNIGEVYREIFLKGSKTKAIKKAFDVYEYLRGNYGMSVALSFRAWIDKQ